MSHNIEPLNIKEGAIFIADAHYPHHSKEFLEILKAIKDKTLQTPQLFLMGDIFDLLFSCGEYIKSFSKEAIDLLNELSNSIEIYYLEGNHDFCLSEVFPNIKIFKRKMQPVRAHLNGKTLMLSHGDKFCVGFGYEIYSYLLRSCKALCILLPIEKRVIDYWIKWLSKKRICHKFEGFNSRALQIISKYPKDIDLVVEAHFHQGEIFKNYISLPSLACQKEIAIIKNSEFKFIKI